MRFRYNDNNDQTSLGERLQTFMTIIKLIITIMIIYVIYRFYMKFFGCSNPKIEDGKPCDKNCDCKNGACGRATAADGAELTCCNSGKTTGYAGFDYCGDMPDDSVCWSNAMCQSGFCRDNGGGTRKGKCGKGIVNDSCGINNDCKNGACGRATAADGAELTCCKSGKTQMFGGFDYCTDMPDGSVCWSDAMCQSGLCDGNGGGTSKGVCKSRKKVNENCDSNSDCSNNSCARATAADNAAKVCCPNGGESHTYAGFDYCTNMPNGSSCWSDSMCSSGSCSGNWGGLKRGTCS
jgi:hypothetical protein